MPSIARTRAALVALRRRLDDDRGIALVTALGVLFVLSLSLTSIVYYTSTNSRTSARERADQQARALAEAGVNNALAVLYKQGVNLEDASLLPGAQAPNKKAYEGGSTEWYGVLSQGSQWQWQVTATGTVKNPTGPGAADVKRTLTANVGFAYPQATGLQHPVWNWIYSGATGAVCDMTIDQSVSINAPLYVVGNLCMKSTAKVVRASRPVVVVVEGNATLSEPQNAIGASNAKIDQVYVGGSCQYKNNALVPAPCPFNTTQTNIWADALYPTSEFLRTPEPDWAKWYERASPGPRSGCTTSTGTPPVFDVDNVLGGQSVPGVFHLTPSTSSYTCVAPRGELSWNHQTKVLKVVGTVFLDGSAKIENGLVATYQAFSTIYVTGTLLIKNSSVCAHTKSDKVGSACDNAPWDPNQKMLILAARGSGGQVSADTSIQLVSSEFQGGLYGKWAVSSSTTTSTQGPQVSEDVVQIGQSNSVGFPLITQVPSGTPLNPIPVPVPQAPDVG